MKRLREFQLQPLLGRIPADRLVAKELILLAVGAKEQPLGGPTLPPPICRHVGGFEVVTYARQLPFAATGRHRSLCELLLDIDKAVAQHLQADGLGVMLSSRAVAVLLPDRHRQPPLDGADATPQRRLLRVQVAQRELKGIFARAGNRAGPTRR